MNGTGKEAGSATIAESQRHTTTEETSAAIHASQSIRLSGITTSERIDRIFPAFVKAWNELDGLSSNAKNDHFSSSYTDFGGIVEGIKPVMKKHGLAPFQGGWVDQTGTNVTQTMLIHESGQWIADSGLRVPVAKDSAHAHGSGLTYEARYGLRRISGVPTGEDDDGNGATMPSNASQEPREATSGEKNTNTAARGSNVLEWPFGKKKGTALHLMPTSDLEWFIENRKPEAGDKWYESNLAFYEAVIAEKASREDGDIPL